MMDGRNCCNGVQLARWLIETLDVHIYYCCTNQQNKQQANITSKMMEDDLLTYSFLHIPEEENKFKVF